MSVILAALIGDPTWAGACVALCGGVTGVISMLAYAKLSPQSRIAAVSEEAAAARVALNRFDGDDATVMWSLTKQAIGLSLRQMQMILLPTLLAGGCVLATAALTDGMLDFSKIELVATSPSWLGSGHMAFWLPLCLTAVVVKWGWSIK